MDVPLCKSPLVLLPHPFTIKHLVIVIVCQHSGHRQGFILDVFSVISELRVITGPNFELHHFVFEAKNVQLSLNWRFPAGLSAI